MNLTELQVELRSIEGRISLLHSEIEKMKPQTEEEKKTDFDKITKLAKKHPISNSTIQSMSAVDKKKFVNSLAFLLLLDDRDIYSRLLYLNRLAYGGGLDLTAEDLYKNGLEFKQDDIDKLCTDLLDYKYMYMVEAFIMANISENEPVHMFGVIADMAEILGCDKEEIHVVATVAKAKLQNDLNVLLSLPVLSKNRWSNCFHDYLDEDWLISQRRCCGLLFLDKHKPKPTDRSAAVFRGLAFNFFPRNDLCVVKERIQDGQIVRKGEVIAVYEEEIISSIGTEKKKIIAPCDGVVYFMDTYKATEFGEGKDKYCAVYVVSYFDDYEKIRNWHFNIKNSEERNKHGDIYK